MQFLPRLTDVSAQPEMWLWPCMVQDAIKHWRRSRRKSLQQLLATANADAELQWRHILRGRIDVELLAESVTCPPDAAMVDIAPLLNRLSSKPERVLAGLCCACCGCEFMKWWLCP